MSSLNKYLKSSQNYIWNTSLVLGKGATASVYQGMSKITGESVAVKFFNNVSHMRPYEVQRREYEVLSKINHVNIVKLFAIEEEVETKNNVLVMELCNGGSLFNILDDPMNGFGIEEKEFLLVLEHLAAGLKHLTDLKIIHRDLKPGNIMRFISEEGQSIYKLTDFGAARELEDDQKFISLYGTEEYLHPGLYEKAVLKKPLPKAFSSEVDLWSIGVTLYHIATGSLPFRPYGGRNNRQMMFKITSEKKPGVISGVQYKENGEVDWNTNLPDNCLLCPDLRYRVRQILAGLLECNENLMWTFEKFFESVTQVLSLRPVNVFCVNEFMDLTVYVNPNEKILRLKTMLESKFYIPAHNQLIIWNKQQLDDNDSIVFTAPDEPIILLDSKATCLKAPDIFPIKIPEILTVVSTSGDQDAHMSKTCASISYCLFRQSEQFLTHYKLINQVPQHIMALIESNIKILNEKRDSCFHLIESLVDHIEYTIETSKNLSKCSPITKDGNNLDMKDIVNLRKLFHDSLEKSWKELLPKIIDINKRFEGLSDRWHIESKSTKSVVQIAKTRSEYLCNKIKESWLFLHKNKSSKVVVGNESQLHNLEKIRVDTNCKKLSKTVYEDSYQALIGIAERLDDWYNDAHVALVQSSCLNEELDRLMKNRDQVISYLNTIVEKQQQQWQALIAKSSMSFENIMETHSNSATRTAYSNVHVNVLDEIPRKSSNASVMNGESLPGDDNMNQYNQENSICSHGPDELVEEIKSLQETQNLLRASLSENQSLFSELVAITFTSKKP